MCVCFSHPISPVVWFPLNVLYSLTVSSLLLLRVLNALLYSSAHNFLPPIAHRFVAPLQLLDAMVTATAFSGLQPDIQTMPPFPP